MYIDTFGEYCEINRTAQTLKFSSKITFFDDFALISMKIGTFYFTFYFIKRESKWKMFALQIYFAFENIKTVHVGRNTHKWKTFWTVYRMATLSIGNLNEFPFKSSSEKA